MNAGDVAALREACEVLRRHREQLETNGGAATPAFRSLETLMRVWVSEGQQGTKVGDLPGAPDPAGMAPIVEALTFDEAAFALRVSKPMIKREVTAGRLSTMVVGSRARRIPVAALREYVASRTESRASTSPDRGPAAASTSGSKAASESSLANSSRIDRPAPGSRPSGAPVLDGRDIDPPGVAQ